MKKTVGILQLRTLTPSNKKSLAQSPINTEHLTLAYETAWDSSFGCYSYFTTKFCFMIFTQVVGLFSLLLQIHCPRWSKRGGLQRNLNWLIPCCSCPLLLCECWAHWGLPKWRCQLLSHVWLFATPQGSSVHGILQARLVQCVSISFSRGSPWPRDWTQVSCIAGRFFTIWATREFQGIPRWLLFCHGLCSEDRPWVLTHPDMR